MNKKNLKLRQTVYPGDDVVYWAIPAQEVKDCIEEGNIPEITLPNGGTSGKPRVGIILGQDLHPDREEKDYSIHPDYVEAVAKSGGEPIFISYQQIEDQMENLDGILLSGGAFDSPPEWYDKPIEHEKDVPGARSFAYIRAVMEAQKKELPTFGICAGYQMMAGMLRAKMIAKINVGRSKAESHKQPSKYIRSHKINILPGSKLYEILGKPVYDVNSSHNEALTESVSMFNGEGKFEAVAWDQKGMIEAIEVKEPWNEFTLGVQFHPECMAKMGDPGAIKMFKRFVEASKNYQHHKSRQAIDSKIDINETVKKLTRYKGNSK